MSLMPAAKQNNASSSIIEKAIKNMKTASTKVNGQISNFYKRTLINNSFQSKISKAGRILDPK
jgi:hypothetical protein